ncbi:MAG: uncharacterized protein QOI54_947 [Actinomycetota bacterium]|jgi:uncharacterized membrane protein (UPF0182 family)|nr:uncharacterized protein [Actinomycetota bacterium]
MPGGPPGAAGAPRRPVMPPRRRGRALLPTLLILGALLIGFSIFTGFYTDLLWYQSVDYASVFTRTLRAKSLLFFLFGIVFAVAVSANFVIAYRNRPTYQALIPGQAELDRYRTALEPYKRLVVIAIAVLLGLIAGSSASGQWRTYLEWRHGASFGVKDPQFGKDISFFTFDLPWYRFMLSFLFAAVVIALIAAAVTHYLYGGLRLQPLLGERATPAARVHLSVLLGVFVLLKAVAYWLDRYGLAVKESRIGRADFSGLAYTDVNAVLLGRTILAIISLICAALFFANIVRRTWLLPAVGVGGLVLSALLIGGIYPAIVQRFEVKPSERTKEAPYIRKNIDATRAAYGIDDVDVRSYSATTKATAGQLRSDSDTTASIRLLDPAIMSPTYKNLQQIRAYYDFQDDLDVDRYTIEGKKRDVVVAARELDLTGLPDAQRNWINDHTVYTHGFGFVAALGNTTNGGRPSFVSSNIPPQGEINGFQPRIYFGEESPTYSIVGAPPGAQAQELDFPTDTGSGGQRNNTYKGGGGVAVNSLWRKLIFASKYQESNILLSNQVNPASRILYDRHPKTRVEKVAPWLSLDGDPYPAVVGKKIVWIVDGYTTSNGYPYSTRKSLDVVTTDSQSNASTALVAPVQRVNYIRNSVKATVDAYTGKVTLYEWDTKDPVLKTWENAYPNTVKPRSSIGAELMSHFRYPEDLFKVQRELLAHYHVSNPRDFYSGSDFWRVPVDPTRETTGLQPPYFLTLRMPGQSAPTFSLTSTYVPTGDRNNLAAFVAVSSDPGPDYGKFRVLQLPRSVQINGPSQVQNQFISDDVVAEQLNILRRGTTVKNGNLLTLPVGGGLLYVEPVYVQAEATTSFPLLRKVLVSFGDRVAFEDTLQAALDAVFAGESGGVPAGGGGTTGGGSTGGGSPGTGGGGGTATNPTLAAALADAQQALRDSRAALQKGDFAAYGTAQQQLQDAITRALAAEQQATPPSPSPSPSPSRSAGTSPSPSASASGG